MTLNTGQALAAIGVMAAVTFLTRALPFLSLTEEGKSPGSFCTWDGCCLRLLSPCSLSIV